MHDERRYNANGMRKTILTRLQYVPLLHFSNTITVYLSERLIGASITTAASSSIGSGAACGTAGGSAGGCAAAAAALSPFRFLQTEHALHTENQTRDNGTCS